MQVKVDATPCTPAVAEIFNPYLETWRLPLSERLVGKLTIADKNGKQVYTAAFQDASEINWTGVSIDHQTLLPGLYLYTVEYLNGSVKQGSVTIAY